MAKRCPKCGQDNPDWASFCQRCGEYFRGTQAPGDTPGPAPGPAGATPTPGAPGQAPGYGYPPQYQPAQRGLLGATIVLILATLDTIAVTLVTVYLEVTGRISPPANPDPVLVTLSLIGLALTPLPLVAGLLAYKRSVWGLAVGCAALGMLTAINSFYFESGIFCLVGLILLVRRRALFIS